MSTLMDKVIEYLKHHPNAKPREIADYLGVNLRIVRAILAKLRDRGIVIRSEKGYVLRTSGIDVGSIEEGIKAEEISKPVTAIQATQQLQSIQTTISSSLEDRINRIENEIKEIRKTFDSLREAVQQIQRTPSTESSIRNIEGEILIQLAEAIEILALALQRISMGDTAISDLVDEALEKIEKVLSITKNKKTSRN
ncbi:Helix-turn-helix type 11 domain protein [Ignisphaera aggregans DSM 17230]|uniref:Helix-turn-helix type 11 domain protein n=1 Tax=Ignisphaera aggregans (strain DSM 17230 / JCM 13409 / AQ1.S1) TaxID=583356 RepID=E0SSC9_IGNAA|nr:Helix-turn-helix type 11 domain protein [Ignisphaera aggregans DSM 17230]